METLDGRTAAVTGAASGIGLAVTEALVAAGVRVVMADRDADRLDEQAARFQDAVLPVVADVADPDAVERVAAAAVDRWGALHIGVNNAGVHARGRVWELPLAEWQRVLDAIRHRRDYVYTDDHSAEAVNARLTRIIAARAKVVTP